MNSITTKDVLFHVPCRSKGYLEKIYPMTFHQCVFQATRNGVRRPIMDRVWIVCALIGANRFYSLYPIPRKDYLPWKDVLQICHERSATKVLKELYEEYS